MNTKQHNTTIRANFTLPGDLYAHFCAVIPKRQMSKVISQLMQKEIEKRDARLFKIAQAVEQDEYLNKEMSDWDAAVDDGLDDL